MDVARLACSPEEGPVSNPMVSRILQATGAALLYVTLIALLETSGPGVRRAKCSIVRRRCSFACSAPRRCYTPEPLTRLSIRRQKANTHFPFDMSLIRRLRASFLKSLRRCRKSKNRKCLSSVAQAKKIERQQEASNLVWRRMESAC